MVDEFEGDFERFGVVFGDVWLYDGFDAALEVGSIAVSDSESDFSG